jgi:hypothetical protein
MSGEYVGAVNGDGRPHGGTYKVRWRNGDVYIGEWNDGIKHGQGTYKCAYGVYIGKWNVGNMHGQGTFMIDDVVVYDGDWKDGKMVGKVPEGKVNITRVASRKVSMGFLREQDFSRDQPCETRLLARLKSRMV